MNAKNYNWRFFYFFFTLQLLKCADIRKNEDPSFFSFFLSLFSTNFFWIPHHNVRFPSPKLVLMCGWDDAWLSTQPVSWPLCCLWRLSILSSNPPCLGWKRQKYHLRPLLEKAIKLKTSFKHGLTNIKKLNKETAALGKPAGIYLFNDCTPFLSSSV